MSAGLPWRAVVSILVIGLFGCYVDEPPPRHDDVAFTAPEVVLPVPAVPRPLGRALPSCSRDGRPDGRELDCSARPDLCDRPVTQVRGARGVARPITLVFLPEGFHADEIPSFVTRVNELVSGMLADHASIVARQPDAFEVQRVELDGNPLGACLEADRQGLSQSRFLDVDDDAARFAARTHVPSVDVIVVIVNTSEGRASANLPYEPGTQPIVRLTRRDGHRTLTHELGHSLVGLGDEYEDTPACYPARPVVDATAEVRLMEVPNLSLDASGAKWSHITMGSELGGARYGSCIHHPTNSCIMRSHDAAGFCPVCDAAISQMFALRAGSHVPPACEIELDQARLAVSGPLAITARAAGGHPPFTLALKLDGRVVSSGIHKWYSTSAEVKVDAFEAPEHVELTCTDALGDTSTASLSLAPSCTKRETAECPAARCVCNSGASRYTIAPCANHVCKSPQTACAALCGPSGVAAVVPAISAAGAPECDAVCAERCSPNIALGCRAKWCFRDADGAYSVDEQRTSLREELGELARVAGCDGQSVASEAGPMPQPHVMALFAQPAMEDRGPPLRRRGPAVVP